MSRQGGPDPLYDMERLTRENMALREKLEYMEDKYKTLKGRHKEDTSRLSYINRKLMEQLGKAEGKNVHAQTQVRDALSRFKQRVGSIEHQIKGRAETVCLEIQKIENLVVVHEPSEEISLLLSALLQHLDVIRLCMDPNFKLTRRSHEMGTARPPYRVLGDFRYNRSISIDDDERDRGRGRERERRDVNETSQRNNSSFGLHNSVRRQHRDEESRPLQKRRKKKKGKSKERERENSYSSSSHLSLSHTRRQPTSLLACDDNVDRLRAFHEELSRHDELDTSRRRARERERERERDRERVSTEDKQIFRDDGTDESIQEDVLPVPNIGVSVQPRSPSQIRPSHHPPLSPSPSSSSSTSSSTSSSYSSSSSLSSRRRNSYQQRNTTSYRDEEKRAMPSSFVASSPFPFNPVTPVAPLLGTVSGMFSLFYFSLSPL